MDFRLGRKLTGGSLVRYWKPALALLLGVSSLSLLGAGVAAAKDKRPSKEQMRAYAELTKRYEDERGQVAQERAEAIQKLGELKIRPVAEFFKKALEHPKEDPIVLELIIRALGKDGSKNAVITALTTGFEVTKPRTYYVIGDSFREVKDPDAIDWLVKAGWKTIPQLEPEGQTQFLRVLDGIGEPRVAKGVTKLLGHPKLPPESQAALVEILRSHKHKSAVSKIAKLMKFDHADLRVMVLYALREMQATEQSQAFMKALKDKHWQVRVVAVDILRGTKDPELVSNFIECLDDSSDKVQIAAVAALVELGGEEVMDPMIAALGKAEGRVKDDLAEGLVRLTGQDFGTDSLGWEAWWQSKRGSVKIARISRDKYNDIKEKSEKRTTGLYYGLRVISKHVAFVIDVSGSMAEPYNVELTSAEKDEEDGDGRTGVVKRRKKGKDKSNFVRKKKIEVAQEELIKVLGGIRNGTQFNIVKFSGMFGPWKPALTEMSDAVRDEAVEFVEGLSPGGQTNVFDTLMFAMNLEEVNTIYFLSDGTPTAGRVLDHGDILNKVAAANEIKKVKIYTIGFHLDPEAEKLMKDLAEQNYGRFVKR